MYCISISHKCSPVAVREQFAFTKKEQAAFARQAVRKEHIHGAVVLSTCNRSEIYYTGDGDAMMTMEELFADYKSYPVEKARKYYMHYAKEGALSHFFKVVCGLDSMVLGEDEILGQVKEAYEHARKAQTTDREINLIFQGGIACAKEIKTDTKVSKASVSVGTLAARAVCEFSREHKNVLIMGMSGKTGSIIMKNLMKREDVTITGTSRNHNRLQEQLVGYQGVQAVSYAERYQYMDAADVVVSATVSPHYTVTRDELKEYLTTKKQRLFLDLAVPRDIDRSICDLYGVTVRDIDYFSELSRHNDRIREQALVQAEEIMLARMDETRKELLFHRFYPNMEEVAAHISRYPAHKLLYTLRDVCDSRELEVVLQAFMRLK